MKIVRYNEFILEKYDKEDDTRTSVIKADSIIDYLNENVSWYMDNIKTIEPIWRGIEGSKYWVANDKSSDINYEPILKVSPSKFIRRSKNTYNFYIELLDYSPYWLDYPKRSESIICSTDNNYAENYGYLYRVIPLKENSKISVCSSQDVFDSFEYLSDKINTISGIGKENIASFNTWLRDTFELHFDSGYEEMLDKMNDVIEDIAFNDNELSHEFRHYVEELSGQFIDDLEKWMSPIKNGFSLIKYNRNTTGKDLIPFREVYTDADCILVLESEFRKELENYEKD